MFEQCVFIQQLGSTSCQSSGGKQCCLEVWWRLQERRQAADALKRPQLAACRHLIITTALTNCAHQARLRAEHGGDFTLLQAQAAAANR